MNRKRRTEILIKSPQEVAAKLANEIETSYEVEVIEEPNHGLAMVKMRESAKKSLFYIGEVLVTECKVQVAGSIGIGIVKGDFPELSRSLAIIDAACQAGLKETEAWPDTLAAEEVRLLEKKRAFEKGVLRTKVNFETMDVD